MHTFRHSRPAHATPSPRETVNSPGANPACYQALTPETAVEVLVLAQLQRGELAVVERPDPDKIEHALVPAETARAMAALSPKAVRFLNDASGEKVGFLSDEEISARAHETSMTESDAAPSDRDGAVPDAAAPEREPNEAWVTVKRAPL